jgi:hypothetical protein
MVWGGPAHFCCVTKLIWLGGVPWDAQSLNLLGFISTIRGKGGKPVIRNSIAKIRLCHVKYPADKHMAQSIRHGSDAGRQTTSVHVFGEGASAQAFGQGSNSPNDIYRDRLSRSTRGVPIST